MVFLRSFSFFKFDIDLHILIKLLKPRLNSRGSSFLVHYVTQIYGGTCTLHGATSVFSMHNIFLIEPTKKPQPHPKQHASGQRCSLYLTLGSAQEKGSNLIPALNI